jgi:hypothetical protein
MPVIRPFLTNGNAILPIIMVGGEITHHATAINTGKGKTVGQPFYMNCFVCWKYLTPDDVTSYHHTYFCCKYCNMPLCNNIRDWWIAAICHALTCEEEYTHSCGGSLLCSEKTHLDKWGAVYPPSEQFKWQPP